ncbi:MAG: hypothetical protein NUV51_03975 [Sulfuricaulis sp.]|nr:hypothetical protein [Sulfuricaulis sp.]
MRVQEAVRIAEEDDARWKREGAERREFERRMIALGYVNTVVSDRGALGGGWTKAPAGAIVRGGVAYIGVQPKENPEKKGVVG